MNYEESIPLYKQVSEKIRDEIISKKLRPGSKIATEKFLCEKYDVSRVTIRKAFEDLIEQNCLERRPNLGMFVADPQKQSSKSLKNSLYFELSKQGIKVTSKLLSMVVQPAGMELSKLLKCSESSSVIIIHRVRYANSKPIADQTIYLKDSLFHGINPWKLEDDSLRRIMNQEFNVAIANCEQTVVAAMPAEEQLKNLNMKPETPLVHIKSIYYSDNGEVAEYSDVYYLSEEFEYSMTLGTLS
jgi:DNA-binding GntR family transcriptional regulator